MTSMSSAATIGCSSCFPFATGVVEHGATDGVTALSAIATPATPGGRLGGAGGRLVPSWGPGVAAAGTLAGALCAPGHARTGSAHGRCRFAARVMATQLRRHA